jgi:putative transposase
MSRFNLHDVLQMTTGDNIQACFRLCWQNAGADRAWIIEIPPPGPGTPYCKGPVILELSALGRMFDRDELVVTRLEPLPLWQATDEELKARYRTKDGRCPALDACDMRWSWMKELVQRHTTADIFEGNLIPGWVRDKAREVKKNPAKIYHAIHIYFASGCAKNALRGNWIYSGGKGKSREQATKLGRPNAAAAAGLIDKGYFLQSLDKRRLRHGWKHYLPGSTVEAAFGTLSGVFYRREQLKVVDGEYVPDLLPPNERPTLEQFRRWGPKDDPALAAWRMKLSPKDWINNYKGLSGSAKDGIVAIGQLAYCDTGTNDVHLVSVVSRLKPVGPVNRLLIHEGKSELIMGTHCGFEAPSGRTFLMAVANAASDKVEYYARYGLTITPEQAPAMAVKVYLGDNGEYRSAGVFDALSQFGATVELAKSGIASAKGPVEGLHHVMHARVDHTLAGTTRGQMKKRGEGNPILESCWNFHEYMREFLKEVLYYNTEEIVEHLRTAEMRREGVKATRIEIYNWLVKKGYVVSFKPDVTVLRAHLYAALPAQVDADGVYLLREDCGNKVERIRALKYVSPYLEESGLLEHARKNGPRRITVRGIPEEPATMWMVTDQGLKELACTTADPVLLQQGTIHDCIVIQDDDKINAILGRGADEQRRSDIATTREAVQSRAQAEKREEMAALPKKPSKADQVAGVKANRRAEVALMQERNAPSGASDTALALEQPPAPAVEDNPARQALLRYLETRSAS